MGRRRTRCCGAVRSETLQVVNESLLPYNQTAVPDPSTVSSHAQFVKLNMPVNESTKTRTALLQQGESLSLIFRDHGKTWPLMIPNEEGRHLVHRLIPPL